MPATAPHALPRGRRGRTARGRRGATSRRRRRRTRLGGFSSRRGCCCCRGIVRFLFLLRRLLRLLLLVRVGRHESGTGPPRSWFASFFLLSVRQFRLKEPSAPARGSLFTVLKRQTVSLRLRRPRDYYSLRVQSLRCRLRNKARNRQTMISCLDLYRAGFRVGPGFSFSLSFLRRSSRHPLYAAAPLPPPPPLSRATGGRRRTALASGAKGTAAKGERIEAAPREVRLRDGVDPRGGDLSILTEKGLLHQFLLVINGG